VVTAPIAENLVADQTNSMLGASPARLPTYVLITPARNEAKFIELTIEAVTRQTPLPLKWVIVSDGSTDGTDEIVERHAAGHEWIELLRLPQRAERHFAGKVMAIHAGLARVLHLPYEVIACLDADITFGPDYFSFLLERLSLDPYLGLAGTPYRETTSETYDYRFVSVEHVSGACQVFRRPCFEEIGGYVAVRGGAIDTIAATTARMKGWKTRAFTEKICFHHREVGTAQGGQLRARFNLGKRDYLIGNHPLWEVFRCAYQTTKRPFLIRAVALWAGYLSACLHGEKRPVSREFIAFRRREQMDRLGEKLHRVLHLAGSRRKPTPA
jgi:glycosyltransferase involved in cell wall biosynthesis